MKKYKPLLLMLAFYAVDFGIWGPLFLIAYSKDFEGDWFGEQGLSAFLWLFLSIILYIVFAIWTIVRGVLLIREGERKTGLLTIMVATPLLPWLLIKFFSYLLLISSYFWG